MASYDITFLQSTLVPVVSGLPVTAYLISNGESVAQAILDDNVEGTGTTDVNGHINVSLPVSCPLAFSVGAYGPSSATTPATGAVFYVPVYSVSGTTHITGVLENADGTPQVGATVTANLNASGPVLATNLILAKTVTATTDINGNWSMNLISNDAITEPKNTLYTFVFTLPPSQPTIIPFVSYGAPIGAKGISFSHVVHVPNTGSVNFATLI